MNARIRLPDHIDTLLLDLDGTLLDLAFDTHFWHEIVPEYFGRTRGMTAAEALAREIGPRLRSAEGTLNWYSLDYWSQMLELDLSAIKSEHDSRIAWLPGARDFLQRQRAAGRKLVLATNSHPETLRIKDEKVAIRPLLDAVYSSHQFGAPKEHAEFWLRLRKAEPYDPARTAFIDDSAKVLIAARAAGIDTVIAITEPDSSSAPRTPPVGFSHVTAVSEID
ncbi:MAG: HAD-IA family hydrolase [Pseudomonadota bacterium]